MNEQRPSKELVDSLMEDVQSFASAWSLVGGRFDSGNMLEDAESQKAELRDRLVGLCQRLEMREELVDGYEKQLGIADADATITVGSEIARLLEIEKRTAAEPPADPWEVFFAPKTNERGVLTDTHRLTVSGPFGSQDEKRIYCERLAAQLNRASVPPLDARYCPFNHKPCEPIDLAEETSETKEAPRNDRAVLHACNCGHSWREHQTPGTECAVEDCPCGYYREIERLEFAPPADPGPAEQWSEPAKHCQNGGDVCLAGNKDGICCPDDSCDIDDGMTSRDPRRAATETSGGQDA